MYASRPMLNPPQSPDNLQELSTRQAIQAAIRLFESGLPLPKQWLESLCKIPAHAWTFSMSRVTNFLDEYIKVDFRVGEIDFAARLLERSKIVADGRTEVEHRACVDYRLESKSTKFSEISLDNFPSAIEKLMSSLRIRLIEEPKYFTTKSILLEEAVLWQKANQWGLSCLEKLLVSPNAHTDKLTDADAVELTKNAISKYLPASSDGDYHEFEVVLKKASHETEDAHLNLVVFSAPMYDRHFNQYSGKYLFIAVYAKDSTSSAPVEFIFDSQFDKEFSRYFKLLR